MKHKPKSGNGSNMTEMKTLIFEFLFSRCSLKQLQEVHHIGIFLNAIEGIAAGHLLASLLSINVYSYIKIYIKNIGVAKKFISRKYI